jgi:two-component system, NarL family, sensor kinase
MKKRKIIKLLTLLLVGFIFASLTCFAQTQKIDSLKKQLIIQTNSIPKLETLFELCELHNSMPQDSFSSYIKQAKKIIEPLKNKDFQIKLKYHEVVYLTKQSRADSAFAMIESQLSLINDKTNHQLKNKFLFAKTRLLIRTNKQKEAIQASISLLQDAETIGDQSMQLKTLIQIGWAYMELEQYKEALTWFYKAKAKYEYEGFTEKSFATCYSNIAAVYNDLHKIDSAELYITKAIDLAKQEQNLAALANCYYIYSDICVANKNNVKAESLLQQGLQIRKLIGDAFYIVSDITQLGIFYANNNQPQKGIAVIKEGITLAQKNNLYAKLPILYNALAKNYSAASNYKNYAATLNKVIELKDSLYQRNKADALQEIQTKYEVQKKETLIAQQKLGLFQRKLLLYGAGILAILLSMFFAYQFNKYKQQQKAIMEEKKIQQQTAIKDAEDKERKRIASELHDNLGVQANAILHNSSLLGIEKENQKNVVADLQETAKEMLLNLRETLWAMKTTDVQAMNLWFRIINFMKQMGRHYTNINFVIEGDVPKDTIITSTKALNIVLVLQETVNNAVKHAAADIITTTCSYAHNTWTIEVKDNGLGFNIKNAELKADSYGLQNMKERAIENDFTYTLSSSINEGTHTSIIVGYV